MKVWFVFGFDTYYPCGGMDDFLKSFETEEEAKGYQRTQYSIWGNVEIVNMTKYLEDGE